MDLKKKKRFAPKKEDSFLMSLFFSYCFSFEIKKDLVLVKFYYNAADQSFWKLLENLWGNACDGDHLDYLDRFIFSKWIQIRAFFYQFSKHLFIVASKY